MNSTKTMTLNEPTISDFRNLRATKLRLTVEKSKALYELSTQNERINVIIKGRDNNRKECRLEKGLIYKKRKKERRYFKRFESFNKFQERKRIKNS